jgi:anti-sigma factor RsiW
MKNTEQLLDLQAYVDGELPEERRRQIEAALPSDLDARELVDGLRQLGTLIRAHEPTATVPASREFYWSQIRRQIEAEVRAEHPKAPAASAALGWLRWLIPALGVAAVAVVISTRSGAREITLAGGGDVTLADVSSTVFRSESDGVTVHWIQ